MTRTRHLRLCDHRTTITENGDGNVPVVLVHSALLDRHVWDPIQPHLRGWRLITYDLRGHGDATGGPVRDIGQLAGDLGDILDVLRLDRVALVGVSMGGAVAQRFALSHPDRIHALGLVTTAVEFPRDVMMQRASSLTESSRAEVVDETLRRWFSEAAVTADAAPVVYARERLATVSPAAWQAVWHALATFSVAAEASDFDRPVLAVSGSADTSTPPAARQRIAELYPRCRYVEVRDAPHLLPLEKAARLGQELDAFLSSAAAA